MGGKDVAGRLMINGKLLTVEIPSSVKELLVDNGHTGDYLTKTDLSPYPVAGKISETPGLQQKIKELDQIAAKSFAYGIRDRVVSSNGILTVNGDYRVGRIDYDGQRATITVAAPALGSVA